MTFTGNPGRFDFTGNPGEIKAVKVHLPNSAFLGNIDPFLRNLDLTSNPNLLNITANENWISVHPVVLSLVAALGLRTQRVVCEELTAASRGYIVRMGLFSLLGIPSNISITEHESAGRFIPLSQIRTPGELSKFITDMIPLLHLEKSQSETIGYIVSELVGNVIEHAQTSDGAIICAQYYKKSNSIRIGIADTGVGIRTTITQSHNAPTDLDAIRLALRPGITGTTKKEGGTEQNAGAGLFFIKSIASVNRDLFMIYSGSGFYKLLRKKQSSTKHLTLEADPWRDRHSAIGDLPHWLGTVVGVDITLNQTREFSTLLTAIRNTYTKEVREKRRGRYKQPKFI